MMIPTAMSMTLPRITNSLNSLHILNCSFAGVGFDSIFPLPIDSTAWQARGAMVCPRTAVCQGSLINMTDILDVSCAGLAQQL